MRQWPASHEIYEQLSFQLIKIENTIFLIRGKKVILSFYLAEVYCSWKMSLAIFRYSRSQAHRKMSTILSIQPGSILMMMLRLKLREANRAGRLPGLRTKIIDKDGERLKGLDGLAMLLLDVDYDGEIFNMDRTVFAKDIGDDGKIRMTGLKERIAVIAIDKHGNESKTFIIKDE